MESASTTDNNRNNATPKTSTPDKRGTEREEHGKPGRGNITAGILEFLSPPPGVGHWDSQEGHDRFLAAYNAAFADLPEPTAKHDVRTDFGIVRAYHFAGSGSAAHPFLLLPGRAASSPMWADNLPHLLETGDVYTLDLLGEAGMSVQERPFASNEDQASWLAETLDKLPEDAFHVIGVSFGGWSAANLALHDASGIATVTLIDPTLTFHDLPLSFLVRSLPASITWLPKSWRDSVNSYMAGGAPVEDVPIADMIEAGMRHFVNKQPLMTRIPENRLASMEVPTLVIFGGNSVIHDAQTAAETAERVLPDATVRVYEGASHAVNGEEPQRIARDIVELISVNP